MSIKTETYLKTKWLKNDQTEVTAEPLEVVSVNEQNSTVKLSNGETVSMIDLDLSGIYEKIHNPLDNPEIAEQVNSFARVENVKSGSTPMLKQQLIIDDTNTMQQKSDTVNQQDPVKSLIESIIKIKNESTAEGQNNGFYVFNLNVNFSMKYNPKTILKTCKDLGANEDQIIETLRSHVRSSLKEDDILESITISLKSDKW